MFCFGKKKPKEAVDSSILLPIRVPHFFSVPVLSLLLSSGYSLCYFLCQGGRMQPSLVFRSALILSRRSILYEAARARQIGNQLEDKHRNL